MKPSDSQGRASGYPAGGARDHESPSKRPAPLGDYPEDYYGENYPVAPHALDGMTITRACAWFLLGSAIGLVIIRFVVPWLAEVIA